VDTEDDDEGTAAASGTKGGTEEEAEADGAVLGVNWVAIGFRPGATEAADEDAEAETLGDEEEDDEDSMSSRVEDEAEVAA
jgi:hypothetical protein